MKKKKKKKENLTMNFTIPQRAKDILNEGYRFFCLFAFNFIYFLIEG